MVETSADLPGTPTQRKRARNPLDNRGRINQPLAVTYLGAEKTLH